MVSLGHFFSLVLVLIIIRMTRESGVEDEEEEEASACLNKSSSQLKAYVMQCIIIAISILSFFFSISHST